MTLLALVYLRAKGKNKKRKNKYWVSPRLEGRNDHGAYKNLVKELELDGISFQKYCFRLTREQFKQVLYHTEEDITKYCPSRETIGARQRFAITLRSVLFPSHTKY